MKRTYRSYNDSNGGGISFFSLLAVLFIGLKICNVISWSWWWVLSPLWIPLLLAILFLIIYVLIRAWLDVKKGKNKKKKEW